MREPKAVIEQGAEIIALRDLHEPMSRTRHRVGLNEEIAPDAALAEGRYDVEPLRAGITLTRFCVRFVDAARIEVTYLPSIFLGMLLSGSQRSEFEGEVNEFSRPHIPTLVGVRYEGQAHSAQKVGEHCDIAGLVVEPDHFPDLFERMETLTPEGRALCRIELTESALLAAQLSMIIAPPYQGRMAALYRESQSLAALLETQRLLDVRTGLAPALAFAPKRDRAEYARQLIEMNLAEPLTMAEMARELASNETTLRREFRAVFGVTIFEYLRKRRLEVARLLILERRLSVSEVAFRCGYASPANFATAYRKHFGHVPSSAV